LKAAPAVWHNQAIPYQVEFSLNGELNELERLSAGVGQFCSGCRLDDGAEFQLNLVLEELFVNSVKHGGCKGMPNCVHVRLRWRADGVEMEYRDRGRRFDPTDTPVVNIHASLAERSEGGLGIHLVRGIMREVRYERDGEWNRITMRRPSVQGEEIRVKGQEDL
jgi:anti-sigma regulatory factor (Ser/Thr protein kinase)